MRLFLLLFIGFSSTISYGQNVGIGTNVPHASAALDIQDTSRGILIPRMTMVQRNAIANPAEGLMVYQTDSAYGNWIYSHGEWRNTQTNNTSILATNGINLINGFTITNGTFSPSPGRKWKVESINLINDSYSYNLSANFVNCGQGRDYWTSAPFFDCYYHFDGIQLSALKIGNVTVFVNVPSSDPRLGPYSGNCNCSNQPYQFTHTINSTFFDKVKLPVWVTSNESIEVQNGIVLSVSEYQ
jgi:hypothetical protein